MPQSIAPETVLAKKQVDDCIETAQEVVLVRYGASLREFPTPIPPPVLALYIAHESAGVRWTTTGYPEFGLAQLTGKQGDNEVQRFGIHPFDPRSHVWAAQEAFCEGEPTIDGGGPRISKYLEKYGYAKYADLPVQDQITLLLLPRAVGYGCTRALLREAAPYWKGSKSRPILAIYNLLAQPDVDTDSYDGVQSTDVVQLRFLWCATMVLRASEVGIGGLPKRLLPPVERPSGLVALPADFFANYESYKKRAKAEGPKPTGSW
jgi:hypothetical protein